MGDQNEQLFHRRPHYQSTACIQACPRTATYVSIVIRLLQAVCALYIVTAPEGTASTLRAGDSGSSWCRDAVTAWRTLTREKPVCRVAVKSLRRFHNALVKRKWQSRTRKTMSSSRLTNLAAKQRIFSSASRRTMFDEAAVADRRDGELKILCSTYSYTL
jgi:hypothetical protein